MTGSALDFLLVFTVRIPTVHLLCPAAHIALTQFSTHAAMFVFILEHYVHFLDTFTNT